jgi:hypothetical protein
MDVRIKFRGFTCELALLKPAGAPEDPTNNRFDFLMTGTRAGYKFALTDCNAKGFVGHYQATAVPSEPRVTGVHAFRADEFGVIWYDQEGSATKCLASRRLLE